MSERHLDSLSDTSSPLSSAPSSPLASPFPPSDNDHDATERPFPETPYALRRCEMGEGLAARLTTFLADASFDGKATIVDYPSTTDHLIDASDPNF